MIQENSSKVETSKEKSQGGKVGAIDLTVVENAFEKDRMEGPASSARRAREVEDILDRKKKALFDELRRLIGDKKVSFDNAFYIMVENRDVQKRLDEFGCKVTEAGEISPIKNQELKRQHTGHI